MGCGASAKYKHKYEHSQPAPLEHVRSKTQTGTFGRENFIITNTGRIDKHYDFAHGKTLGVGGFGTVRQATCKATGAVRAIKSMPKTDTSERHFTIEVEVMRTLDHPNIIKLYETFEDHKFYYLVLEICTGGELLDAITEARSGFSEKLAAKLIKQMVGAVSYMHAQSIAHRDLKPDNYLLADQVGIESALLKLSDFGLSKACRPGEQMTSKSGTINYVAPEVLHGSYDVKCDVWSLGVMAFLLLSGQSPFQGTQERMKMQVMRGQWSFGGGTRWDRVSDDAKDLITKMLVLAPDERLTAAQAFGHPWLKALAPQASDTALPKDIVCSLRGLQVAHKFENAVLAVMALHLKDDEAKQFRDMFYTLDEDGSGTISAEELKRCFVQQLTSHDLEVPTELNALMADVDADGSGEIDYSEFVARMMDKRKLVQTDVCWAAFRVFDLDGDGAITMKELALVLSGGHRKNMEQVLGVERDEIERVIKAADRDGSGSIDFDEFFKMMQDMANKQPASAPPAVLNGEGPPSSSAASGHSLLA